ncbi:MAG: hypothetical protein WCP85_08520 [Mariniphaga sp.]
MTAQELITQLQTLPPDTKVVIRGYEDGYNDILRLKKVKIRAKVDAHWFDGEFEDCNDTHALDAMDAVDLYGENKNPKGDL